MPPLKLVGTLAIVALGLALSSTGEVASGAPVEITRVSVDSNGVAGDNGSQWPAVSADGRLIVFASWASNLVPNDTNGQEDVFLHDRQGGSTTRVSVNSQGHRVTIPPVCPLSAPTVSM